MLFFKNGKFEGGDLLDIIHMDWNDAPDSATWWDHLLHDDVVVLTIPKNDGQIQICEAFSVELEFIPRQSEDNNPFHFLFWDSAETYVFGDIDRAIQFMKTYIGEFEMRVRAFLTQVQQEMLHDEARYHFESTCDLVDNVNAEFMNDLNEFVQEHSASMEQVLASMKLYILDYYKCELEEAA